MNLRLQYGAFPYCRFTQMQFSDLHCRSTCTQIEIEITQQILFRKFQPNSRPAAFLIIMEHHMLHLNFPNLNQKVHLKERNRHQKLKNENQCGFELTIRRHKHYHMKDKYEYLKDCIAFTSLS